MMKIIIYGQESSKFEYLKMLVQKITREVQIETEIVEVKDTSVFIEKGIRSIPAVEINGEIRDSLGSDFKRFCHLIGQWILSMNSFGRKNRILVPFDYSEAAENALIYALHLSKETDRYVQILHVMEESFDSIDGLYINQSFDLIQTKNKLSDYLDNFNNSLLPNELYSFHSEYILLQGQIASSILKEVQNDDWIVMGNVGQSSLSRKLFGSISGHVANKSDCPVFVIPKNSKFISPKRCLVHSISEEGFLALENELHSIFKRNRETLEVISSNDLLVDSSLYKVHNFFIHKIPKSSIQSVYDNLLGRADELGIQLIVLERNRHHWIQDIIKNIEINKSLSETHIPFLFINKK